MELVKCTEGDMRKAVTFLQSVARFRTNAMITAQDVHEITGVCQERDRKRINCIYRFDRSFQIRLLRIFFKLVIRVPMRN